jgi:hypothetical protein
VDRPPDDLPSSNAIHRRMRSCPNYRCTHPARPQGRARANLLCAPTSATLTCEHAPCMLAPYTVSMSCEYEHERLRMRSRFLG